MVVSCKALCGYVIILYRSDATGYQGLFCPSNKPSRDRLPGSVQLVKTGGRRVFIVKSGHLYLENRGNS